MFVPSKIFGDFLKYFRRFTKFRVYFIKPNLIKKMKKDSTIVKISTEIIPYRYVIIDANDRQVVDNAQGWGFKTFAKAEAYAEAHGWQVEKSTPVESNQLF